MSYAERERVFFERGSGSLPRRCDHELGSLRETCVGKNLGEVDRHRTLEVQVRQRIPVFEYGWERLLALQVSNLPQLGFHEGLLRSKKRKCFDPRHVSLRGE